MQSQIRVSLRPNNQITITKGSWKKKLIDTSSLLGEEKPDRYQLARYRHHLKNSQMAIAKNETFEDRLERLYPPLDIIQKSQRSKKAPSMRLNKPKSFTRFSGQRIREAGAAMDIACKGNMRFCHEVTLTLPANTREAFKALAAYSSHVVNRLFQIIRRNYGDDCLWFFVWEYQKRGALHMHIALYHPDESEGLWIAYQLIQQWNKILCELCELANTDMFAPKQGRRKKLYFEHQHHTAPLRKSVAAYFSKYAGKEESKNNWYIQEYPVSRFWGSNRAVKNIVKENSLQFDFDYHGNDREADRRYTELIERIIEKLSIVSFSSYEFKVQSDKKASMRSYPKKGKVLSVCNGKVFAEGERSTFYFTQSEFKKAMELIKNECEYF